MIPVGTCWCSLKHGLNQSVSILALRAPMYQAGLGIAALHISVIAFIKSAVSLVPKMMLDILHYYKPHQFS